MASSTVENYLKHILLLSAGGDGLVPMGALATALAVVPGTVTTMVKFPSRRLTMIALLADPDVTALPFTRMVALASAAPLQHEAAAKARQYANHSRHKPDRRQHSRLGGKEKPPAG